MSTEKNGNEPLVLDFMREVRYSESYYLPAKEALMKRFPELFRVPPDRVKKRFV